MRGAVFALLLLCQGCNQQGNQIDLTISLGAGVDGRALRRLTVAVSGSVSAAGDYALDGSERWPERQIIRPLPAAGELTVSVSAFDLEGGLSATGQSSLTLGKGERALSVTLEKSSSADLAVPNDLAGPNDLADGGAADLARDSGPDLASVDAGPQTLSVTVSGAGTGSVTSSPTGISCTGACSQSALFDAGAEVVLTAINSTGRKIHWEGDCFSTTGVCRLTMDGPRQVTITLDGNNYIFVTAHSYLPASLPGADGGVDNADTDCQDSAADAGLPGTYRAWLSTSTVNAKDRLLMPGGGSPRGWIRPDGKPFADTIDSLTATHIFYPPSLTESGNPTIDGRVMTGTDASGVADSSNYTCADWTSSGSAEDGAFWGYGIPTASTTDWTFGLPDLIEACQFGGPIYCFEVDLTTPIHLDPVPANARRAFLSHTAFIPTANGIAAADAVCMSDAANNAIANAGGFRALIATKSAPAISRFDLSLGPWYRMDGLPWVKSAADLASLSFSAPLVVGPDLSAQSYLAWTGAASPTGPGADTCDDWTSASSMMTGVCGVPEGGAAAFFSDGEDGCSAALHLYCLEQ